MAKQIAEKAVEDRKSSVHTSKPQVIVHATPVRYESICQRAYDLYLQRGCVHGYHVEDWLEAEKQLVDESIN